MTGERYVTRSAANDASRNNASHHAEEWSHDELALLLACWKDVPEAEVAEALGRTIEACRQRFYEARAGRKGSVRTKVTVKTVTVETETYIGNQDDPDDRWWSPDYYKKG